MKIIAIFLCCFCSIALHAQLESIECLPIPQYNSTFQGSKSDDIMALLDSAFNDFRAKSAIKGMSAAILLPSGQIWQRADGLATGTPKCKH